MKSYKIFTLFGVAFILHTASVFGQLIESQRLTTSEPVVESADAEPEEDNPEEKEFGAIPALTTLLGTRELIPNITLIGAKNFEGLRWYGAIRVFTGAVPGEEGKDNPNASALFVTEASTFGFTSIFSRPLDSNKITGINLSVNYLGKNLRPDSINTVATSVFQGKLGFEVVPVQKMVSVYVNVNALAVADNIESFKEHYSNNRHFKFYIDYGAKLYLDTVPQSDLSIVIDLNFIAQNGGIKAITKNDDLVIPVLKIGLKKSI